jgi:hypothetical protein
MGLKLVDGDVAIRANTVSLSEADRYEDRIMLDNAADEITTEEAAVLIDAVNEQLADDIRRLYVGVAYRHCLIWKNVDDKYNFARPHDIIGRRIGEYLPDEENGLQIDFSQYDYVIDAIDTVTAKIGIIMKCKEVGTPVISCMGTGNKLNPTMFEITDIYKTKVCPLARVMRKELKKRGVESLKVVYSQEEVVTTARTPASISFVPSVAGLLIASEVVRDIMKTENGEWKIEK